MSSDQASIKTHELRSVSLLVCPCGFVCVWVYLCISVCGCVCVWVWVCLCAFEEKEDEERKVTEFVVHGEEREKKVRTEINKVTNAHTTVTVHIFTQFKQKKTHTSLCRNAV